MPPFYPSAVNLPPIASEATVQVMLFRLLAAAILAAIIAYRPWRMLMKGTTRMASDTAQAQVIIAVAGSIMVIIIGDSMARAFGLVGLGAFIRFRSGIKDPRDAAVMFVMIGMGMAVGLGLYVIALVTFVFVAAVIAFLDAADKSPSRRIRVGIDLEEQRPLLAALRPVFPGARVIEAPNGPAGAGRIVLEIEVREDLDAAQILESLNRNGVAGVRGVALVEK